MTNRKVTLVCAATLLLIGPGCGYDLGLERRTPISLAPNITIVSKRSALPPDRLPMEYQKHILPPAQYDHEYDGEITLARISTAELNKLCASAIKPGLPPALGCTMRFYGPRAQCKIWIVTDKDLKARGWDYDIIFRHERGHCNGWHHT